MKNTIKIWPDLDDSSQALIPYIDTKLNPKNTIFVDASNVLNATSSGAALTLVKLLKIIYRFSEATWSVIEPENTIVKELLEKSGFYEVLNQNLQNKDLWWQIRANQESEIFSYINKQGSKVTSFPLYYLKYDRDKYREAVEDFTDYVLNNLSSLLGEFDFRLNIFAKLLKEIAKNSEDHTHDNAFFGLDLLETIGGQSITILFSFCDLGVGIHANIKKYISEETASGRKNISDKFGIVDSYHKAFTPGYSTSKNIRNKGIGMSMILDCANLLGLELSFFDARSRGFIPENNTHSQIRRNFWDTNNPVGFNYYGKLIINKKNERV